MSCGKPHDVAAEYAVAIARAFEAHLTAVASNDAGGSTATREVSCKTWL